MPSILDNLNAAAPALWPSAPALWLEVSPPRGINPSMLLRRLGELAGHVDAINLTDNALGKVKMSGLVFAAAIKERLKIPVVLNVSCRDRNRFALKSDLLGAGAIGIDAVVALNGDKIPPGADGVPIASHDIDAYALLAMVAALNRGDTGEGKALLKALPSLVAGAVANPNRKNIEREFELLERKAAAGARFVITQPVFDAETGRRFIAKAASRGVGTMLGILPVKREAMANYLIDRVKDLSGARSHLDRFGGMSEEEVRAVSLRENLALMKSLARDAAGFIIMSGGGPSLAIELALQFSRWRKEIGK
ncbi:MAG: methylenetetrahydrofolate reductase [Candidatus Binatus sp.]